MDTKEARKLLLENAREDEHHCRQKIYDVLKEYNCVLVGQPVFTSDGRITVSIDVRSDPNGTSEKPG